MSNIIHECFFGDKETLFAALKSHIEQTLHRAFEAQARASIAVSGGSTPAPLYRSLAQSALDWQRTDITLTDERFVPADHADSNEAMLRRTLLSGAASAANFIPLTQDSESAEQAAQISSNALDRMQLPMDLVILGMGNDMHTASLFPDAPELADALNPAQDQRCLALHPASSEHARLSMSLNTLLNSREIVLLITGQDKQETLQRALKCDAIEKAPIAAILLQSKVPVHLYWSP